MANATLSFLRAGRRQIVLRTALFAHAGVERPRAHLVVGAEGLLHLWNEVSGVEGAGKIVDQVEPPSLPQWGRSTSRST